MGKTFSRDPDSDNYAGGHMKANRQETKFRRQKSVRKDALLDESMQPDEPTYGKHTDDFSPRKDGW